MIQDMHGHDPKHCNCLIENCEICSIEFVKQLTAGDLIKRKYITCLRVLDNQRLLVLANWNGTCGAWKDFKCYRLSGHENIWAFIPGDEERVNHSVNPEARLFFKTHLPEVAVDGDIEGPVYVIRKQDVESDGGLYFHFDHLDREGRERFDTQWLNH